MQGWRSRQNDQWQWLYCCYLSRGLDSAYFHCQLIDDKKTHKLVRSIEQKNLWSRESDRADFLFGRNAYFCVPRSLEERFAGILCVLTNKDVQRATASGPPRSFDPANGGKAVLALHGFLIVHILEMATSSSDRPWATALCFRHYVLVLPSVVVYRCISVQFVDQMAQWQLLAYDA